MVTDMSDTNEPKRLTKEQRETRKAVREAEAKKVMAEHERKQKAFNENRERLRAERLAREAANSDEKNKDC